MLKINIILVKETESAKKCFALLASNKYFSIEDDLPL